MFVSKDGTVTGSIDVSKLDQIKPKTDEAKAQLDALKAEVRSGQEQSARDAAVEEAKAQDEQDAERQQREAKQAEETKQLQAEAEAAGVTVDKRWGADRLRQEIEAAKTAQPRKR